MTDDVLNDVKHIQQHYSEYFYSLAITEEQPVGNDPHVTFIVTPVNNAQRMVTVKLTRTAAYQIVSDSLLGSNIVGTSHESFEQVMVAIMGPSQFTALLSSLVTEHISRN